ncbi:mercury methylation ferredoxin HgcB [Oceanispirochaeta sp.]|jgi:NAD-dependent dihydropyrimidine dehydrogenase PreA subunit|uniref:mercury methylation ferredoxin HgcB n=1 Tax=Oceanispirochaeta sp. TaxID=2035350 RepID=UPI00262F35F7|nr:mercury methylation ferredoxin HgcB [Oceanispirochaeta sp.]MDA3958646.1 mercury methylation ferredoxin HgcB [Oceanispirochaeta sp.]
MTYLENGVTLKLNTDICIGCGMCGIVCPHGVYVFTDRKAVIDQRGNCMECGACMINCPVEAIFVDKGVGCAAAVIQSKLKGRSEISCDCGGPPEEETDCCKGGCCC